MQEYDEQVLKRLGWTQEPIVAIIDFDHQYVWTKKHTYPFRDLTYTPIQYYKEQTVIHGIPYPVNKIPLTNHTLSLEESIVEDSLSRQIRSSIEFPKEEFDEPLHLLQQAFEYEMLLACELERRTKGILTKREIGEISRDQATKITGVEDVADKIEDTLDSKIESVKTIEHQVMDVSLNI